MSLRKDRHRAIRDRIRAIKRERRARREYRPLAMVQGYQLPGVGLTTKGRPGRIVWNILGHYGQILRGYTSPKVARRNLKMMQYKETIQPASRVSAQARNFDDVDTRPITVEINYEIH